MEIRYSRFSDCFVRSFIISVPFRRRPRPGQYLFWFALRNGGPPRPGFFFFYSCSGLNRRMLRVTGKKFPVRVIHRNRPLRGRFSRRLRQEARHRTLSTGTTCGELSSTLGDGTPREHSIGKTVGKSRTVKNELHRERTIVNHRPRDEDWKSDRGRGTARINVYWNA